MSDKDRIDRALRKMDEIIAPEIQGGQFAFAITKTILMNRFKTMIEIGSSSGDGSTTAFIQGMGSRPESRLFCVELSRVRFQQLQNRYKNNPQVKCYNVGSTSSFMSREDVVDFYHITQTKKNDFTLDTVLGWYGSDIAYSRAAGVPTNGIELIKKENNIISFDMVLIDGSGYTSRDELRQVYGAKCIALDDINSIKNYLNYYDLVEDPQYVLIEQNWKVRNGFAVFMRAPHTCKTKFNIPPFKLSCHGIQQVLSTKPIEKIYSDLINRVQIHITQCSQCRLFMEKQK